MGAAAATTLVHNADSNNPFLVCNIKNIYSYAKECLFGTIAKESWISFTVNQYEELRVTFQHKYNFELIGDGIVLLEAGYWMCLFLNKPYSKFRLL